MEESEVFSCVVSSTAFDAVLQLRIASLGGHQRPCQAWSRGLASEGQ